MEHITRYCADATEEDFSQDMKLQDAVIRRFQIIGEAAGKVPDQIRMQYPDIPWKKIVAMRNLIIHDYANVNPNEIWQVIQADLPTLAQQLSLVREQLGKETPAS